MHIAFQLLHFKLHCKEMNPDIHVKTGRVVSGDQFISDKQTKQKLIDTYQGDCAFF